MGQSFVTQGSIHSIGLAQEFGNNGFTKREFVLKLTGEGENDQYPNYVGFELHKDKCALIDGYQLGMEIKVAFNLGGRLWAGNGQGEKCFPQMTVWKLGVSGPQQQAQAQQSAPPAPQQQPPYQAPRASQVPPQPQMAPPAPPANQPQGQHQHQAPQPAPGGFDNFDDDIPF